MSVDPNRQSGINHFGSVEVYEAWRDEQVAGVKATAAKLRKEREAAEAEAAKEVEAKRDAANAAELERVKQQAQAAFPGSAAEFEAAWGSIKARYQQRAALDAIGDVDALVARKRASGMY